MRCGTAVGVIVPLPGCVQEVNASETNDAYMGGQCESTGDLLEPYTSWIHDVMSSVASLMPPYPLAGL
jgi:hypothetical protein